MTPVESRIEGLNLMESEIGAFIRWALGGIIAIALAISTFLGGIVWRKTFENEKANIKNANDIKNLKDAFSRQQREIDELKATARSFEIIAVKFEYMQKEMSIMATSMGNIERHIIGDQAKKIEFLQQRIDTQNENSTG